MKKLMIVAAAAVMAVSAQASKFSWGFATELYTENENIPTGDLTGYTAYLVDAATWGAADKTSAASIGVALANNIAMATYSDWNDGSEGYVPASGSDPAYTYYAYDFTDSLEKQSAATGDALQYVIVFDNGEKFGAIDVTGDIWEDGSTAYGQKAFSAEGLSLDTATFTSYGAVPEPTSGLLLLLGVAGLALKRRRA